MYVCIYPNPPLFFLQSHLFLIGLPSVLLFLFVVVLFPPCLHFCRASSSEDGQAVEIVQLADVDPEEGKGRLEQRCNESHLVSVTKKRAHNGHASRPKRTINVSSRPPTTSPVERKSVMGISNAPLATSVSSTSFSTDNAPCLVSVLGEHMSTSVPAENVSCLSYTTDKDAEDIRSYNDYPAPGLLKRDTVETCIWRMHNFRDAMQRAMRGPLFRISSYPISSTNATTNIGNVVMISGDSGDLGSSHYNAIDNRSGNDGACGNRSFHAPSSSSAPTAVSLASQVDTESIQSCHAPALVGSPPIASLASITSNADADAVLNSSKMLTCSDSSALSTSAGVPIDTPPSTSSDVNNDLNKICSGDEGGGQLPMNEESNCIIVARGFHLFQSSKNSKRNLLHYKFWIDFLGEDAIVTDAMLCRDMLSLLEPLCPYGIKSVTIDYVIDIVSLLCVSLTAVFVAFKSYRFKF